MPRRHVIIPASPGKTTGELGRIVARDSAGASDFPRILHAGGGDAGAREVIATAVHELAAGLGAMLGRAVESAPTPKIAPREIRIELAAGAPEALSGGGTALEGDSFAIARAGDRTIVLSAGSERGLIHAGADLLERLGACFAPGVAPRFPRIEPAQLASLAPARVEPAFTRRAFVSDIMTWNYTHPDRLELHLRHDREFIPWMARRGINAFSYIRHAHDTRLRIDEIAPLLRSHAVAAEYGGHVLQILLPRERFDSHPEYFPAGDDGRRIVYGNLCVSNRAALDLVRDGAIKYVGDYPENALLHIWGADVLGGAWCRCGQCRELPAQLQYMAVVNAVADALAGRGADAPPVAYLAYHDTIEPHRGLKPLPNVWFEWAPRERCYVHAIDDPACEINPRYFDSLRRHIDIFEGRGHVFEYYADAILFSGLGFATAAVIARDLRAYHALGLRSISCLTFGAFSALAYPGNLEAFVRGARAIDFEPAAALYASAAGRHPRCRSQLTRAYRAIEGASKLVLDYGDVMHPVMSPLRAARKRGELAQAAHIFGLAIAAADQVLKSSAEPLAAAERELWSYSADVLSALSDYLGALELGGPERARRGDAAIARIRHAIEHLHAIAPDIKGTWGAYDLEWIRELWLDSLRRKLAETRAAAEEQT
jgi:Domain of unknown function (DUF4838)